MEYGPGLLEARNIYTATPLGLMGVQLPSIVIFGRVTTGTADCNIDNLVIDGSELYVGYWTVGNGNQTYFKNGQSVELDFNPGRQAVVGTVLSIFDPGN